MPKFRKNPVVVDAEQLSEERLVTMFEFLGESKNYPECKIGGIDPSDSKFKVRTLEGVMTANLNDWIIKGNTKKLGDHYWVVKPDYFKQNYELINN